MDKKWSFKIIILEENEKNKSVFFNLFNPNFESVTIEAIGASTSEKLIEINDNLVNVSIWEINNLKNTSKIHPLFFRGATGAIFIYDVLSNQSNNDVIKSVKQYLKYTSYPEAPIILIANLTKKILIEERELVRERHQNLHSTLMTTFPNFYTIQSQFLMISTHDEVNMVVVNFIKAIIKWHSNLSDGLERAIWRLFKISEVLPAAYFLSFHETYGSLILSKAPASIDISNKEMTSAIKITSILDIDDITENKYATASFPWLDPKGQCSYIAFTIEKSVARGGFDLFIIGFVSDRKVRDTILEWGLFWMASSNQAWKTSFL